jgi:hypothetical protein
LPITPKLFAVFAAINLVYMIPDDFFRQLVCRYFAILSSDETI